jgi:hypothetical protein
LRSRAHGRWPAHPRAPTRTGHRARRPAHGRTSRHRQHPRRECRDGGARRRRASARRGDVRRAAAGAAPRSPSRPRQPRRCAWTAATGHDGRRSDEGGASRGTKNKERRTKNGTTERGTRNEEWNGQRRTQNKERNEQGTEGGNTSRHLTVVSAIPQRRRAIDHASPRVSARWASRRSTLGDSPVQLRASRAALHVRLTCRSHRGCGPSWCSTFDDPSNSLRAAVAAFHAPWLAGSVARRLPGRSRSVTRRIVARSPCHRSFGWSLTVPPFNVPFRR